MIETSVSVAEVTKEKSLEFYECARRRSSEAYVKYEETGMKENVDKYSAVAVEKLKEATKVSLEYAVIGLCFSKKFTKKWTAEYAKFTAELLEQEMKNVITTDGKDADGKDKLNRYQRRQQKTGKKSSNDIDFDAIMDVVKENLHKAKICFYQVTGVVAGKITENIADEVEEVAEVVAEEVEEKKEE